MLDRKERKLKEFLENRAHSLTASESIYWLKKKGYEQAEELYRNWRNEYVRGNAS